MRHDPIPVIPIGPVLQSLGATLPYNVRGGWQKMRCFAHDDRNPSACVNYDINRYYCFSCGLNEDSIGLIQHAHGIDFISAKREAEILSPSSDSILPRERGDWRNLFG
jgi:CHC2 zinc finger